MPVLVKKEAAAERLILAAIQMCERADDPLAIHVVAMSSLNMLRELLATRGPSFGSRSLRIAMWVAATRRLEGKDFPKTKDDGFNALISEVADALAPRISAGEIGSPEDIDFHLPRHAEQAFYELITAPFNFLKHADRDGDKMLPEDAVEPILATVNAISAFHMLFPGRPLPAAMQEFFNANTEAEFREFG